MTRPSAAEHQEFQAARLRFEHDFAVFRAAVRRGTLDAVAGDLQAARFEARAQALVEWAAALKARFGAA